MIGIVVNKNSRGLMADALLYANYLDTNFFIMPFGEEDKIIRCKSLLCIEELGSEKNIEAMKGKNVCLLMNPEVFEFNQFLKPTVQNINAVSTIIVKTNSLKAIVKKSLPNFKGKIICIEHYTYIPTQMLLIDYKQPRRNIVHYAGTSYMKNTLQNCLAGIKLLKHFPKYFDKFIVKITNSRMLDKFYPDTISSILKAATPNVVISIDKPDSDEEKWKLLSSCRLALCASNAEGFGHYILEAALAGCQVITTNGSPMKDVLSIKDTFSLAKPNASKKCGFGIWYEIDANAIFEAASNLILKSEYKPQNCKLNWDARVEKFHKTFKPEYFIDN